MSISAAHLRILVDAGCTTDDLILAATAMERGDDYRSITQTIEALRGAAATNDQIAIVVMALAHRIVAEQRTAPIRKRDGHTTSRDSNRARRGMSSLAWKGLRETVYERDDYACQYCGRADDLTCDHVLPLLRGGTNDVANLATACRSCNSSKGAKTLEEWLGAAS